MISSVLIATAAQMGHKAGVATADFSGVGADNTHDLAIEFNSTSV
jgi:hypothetical protein